MQRKIRKSPGKSGLKRQTLKEGRLRAKHVQRGYFGGFEIRKKAGAGQERGSGCKIYWSDKKKGNVGWEGTLLSSYGSGTLE